MKRMLVRIIFLLMTFNVFAEEPVFILRQNSILKDENLDKKVLNKVKNLLLNITKKV